VKDAQVELKKNGELSTSTLIGLLGKYGNAVNDVVVNAMNGLATQEKISKALETAYEQDVKAYREAMLEKEMDNQDFYSSWLASNGDTVNKLKTQYGIDANAYKTFAELKTGIETAQQEKQTRAVQDGKSDRVTIFRQIQDAFAITQDMMLAKAQQTSSLISKAYSAMAGTMRGFVSALSGANGLAGQITGAVTGKMNEIKAAQDAQAWQEIIDSLSAPAYVPSKSSGNSKSGGSAKSYYEIQIENLKKLEEVTKRTNQVLERSDEDTSRRRIQNLKEVQAEILAAQKDFTARGLSAASDEVNQLKIMYAGLGDDIDSILSSLSDGLLARHEDLIWQFDNKANNPRTIEQVAADDAAMVDEYRKMQDDVHQLAEYYRSQGVRENSRLIRDLQDKWWDYEKSIRSIYDNLTDAFNDYIDKSSHKLEELGRAAGTAGQRIEIYAQRIAQAQKTIAQLQKYNTNGQNSGLIPLSESLLKLLRNYRDNTAYWLCDDDFFFPAPDRTILSPNTVYQRFRKVLWSAGIPYNGKGNGPRLHDIRHTFAVHTLQKWVETGEDLTAMLPVLSVFMGHKSMRATSRYLRLTAEVYPDVVRQVENTCAYVIPGGETT